MFIDPKNIDYVLIKRAAQIIQKGGIVALPTDTVYGLGAYAGRKDVVDKLYNLKKRPRDKPFSFALGNVNKAIKDYFDVLPPFGYRLMEKFWPGPLTIIYYTSSNEKVGVRIPAHIVTNKILNELGAAVYLPSANMSGQKESSSAQEVENIFGNEVDLIVDGGKCVHSQPSTVVDLTSKPFKILRSGVVSEEDITKTFAKKRILFVCTGNSCRSPMAQFLLIKYLKEIRPYFDEQYEIISRGTYAPLGLRISPSVVSLLKESEDLEIGDFFAQKLDRLTILSSDLIFTMEDSQSRHVLELAPKAKGRVFNLKKFLFHVVQKDIPDPVGRDMAIYWKVYAIIKEAVLELREWL